MVVGGSQETVIDAVPDWTTVMENAASVVCAFPSETLIWMFWYWPTFAAPGVPVSRPSAVLKVSQAGLLTIEKVRRSPFASVAVG